MHVLITGSTGFLGKQTVLELKKDYKLTFIGKKKLKIKITFFVI
jgi:nucleoside-diphosphate-sugar epimerase